MYRRLMLFALSVVAVAVIALVIPLGLAARDIVHAEELTEVADRARVIADGWQTSWARSPEHSRAEIPIPGGDGVATLILPDGTVLGPPAPADASPVVEAAKGGQSATLDLGSHAYTSAPVVLDDAMGVVLISIDSENLREGLTPRLLALAIVSIVLLTFAAVAAWMLARRTARPIKELADTADALADGDLSARAAHSSIREVQDVGIALNRMAQRVEELLADERASAAELAHQLRTPLTVLTVDLDAVPDEELRSRLQEDALALQRTTDEIIRNARRSAREGLRARCDATAVAHERVTFWRVLAEDQGRAFDERIGPGPLWVRLTADDLETLIDILLQNVFIHTPEGTPFGISVGEANHGAVELVLWDGGPGFAEEAGDSAATGTTGLGLSIATRLAEASGGGLVRGRSPGHGGARVAVTLGPAAE